MSGRELLLAHAGSSPPDKKSSRQTLISYTDPHNEIVNFKKTVLEEKLISRALLQDSEPSRAANAISDVFLVNPSKKHDTGEESRGREAQLLMNPP